MGHIWGGCCCHLEGPELLRILYDTLRLQSLLHGVIGLGLVQIRLGACIGLPHLIEYIRQHALVGRISGLHRTLVAHEDAKVMSRLAFLILQSAACKRPQYIRSPCEARPEHIAYCAAQSLCWQELGVVMTPVRLVVIWRHYGLVAVQRLYT